MGINGTNNTDQVTQTYRLPELAPGMLTPEALMSYCQTRLRGIDEQIQTAFAKQKQANDDSQVLSALGNKFTALNPKGNLDAPNTATKMTEMAAAYRDAAKQVSDPALKQKLEDQAAKCDAAAKATEMSPEQYKQLGCDFVASTQKDLNAGTELSMINLQSLMSQRQSSVQMVTNMIQSLGDQMNKIAANIGH